MLLLLFVFLCFCGQVAMFFCIMRGQERLQAAMEENTVRLHSAILQLEARVCGDTPQEYPPSNVTTVPLDSLSMDAITPPPAPSVDDPLTLHLDPPKGTQR